MKMKLLICLLFILSIFSNCKTAEPFVYESDHDMSVMSFNVRYDTEEDGKNKWDNRKEACLALLRKTRPSIFGIQEGRQHQVDFLNDNLSSYDYVGEKSEHGSYGEYKAVFYEKERFQLIESQTFWLSKTPEVSSLGWDANNIRSVTWAHLRDIENDGKSIFIFNTHLDHRGKVSRIESIKLLMQKIQEITNGDVPVFITGDFNTLIRSKAITPLVKYYYSARRFADYTDNIKSFNSYGRWYLNRNIDFIFYKNAHALSFRTVSEDFDVPYVSDHYPIISRFNY